MGKYERDIVAWSEEQGQALRARSANTLDWDNLAEEIETVGRSETRAVVSALRNAITHKLLVLAWPDYSTVNHWRGELHEALMAAATDYAPSMRKAIDEGWHLTWARARRGVDKHVGGAGPSVVALPRACPWSLDELLAEGAALLTEAEREVE